MTDHWRYKDGWRHKHTLLHQSRGQQAKVFRKYQRQRFNDFYNQEQNNFYLINQSQRHNPRLQSQVQTHRPWLCCQFQNRSQHLMDQYQKESTYILGQSQRHRPHILNQSQKLSPHIQDQYQRHSPHTWDKSHRHYSRILEQSQKQSPHILEQSQWLSPHILDQTKRHSPRIVDQSQRFKERQKQSPTLYGHQQSSYLFRQPQRPSWRSLLRPQINSPQLLGKHQRHSDIQIRKRQNLNIVNKPETHRTYVHGKLQWKNSRLVSQGKKHNSYLLSQYKRHSPHLSSEAVRKSPTLWFNSHKTTKASPVGSCRGKEQTLGWFKIHKQYSRQLVPGQSRSGDTYRDHSSSSCSSSSASLVCSCCLAESRARCEDPSSPMAFTSPLPSRNKVIWTTGKWKVFVMFFLCTLLLTLILLYLSKFSNVMEPGVTEH